MIDVYLRFQEFVKVRFHETLDDVDVLHLIDRNGPENISDVDDVLMGKP